MSFTLQIQALLADKRVPEALDLAQNANKTGMTRERFTKVQKLKQILKCWLFVEIWPCNQFLLMWLVLYGTIEFPLCS